MSAQLPAIVPAPVSMHRGAGRPVRLSGAVRVLAPKSLQGEARWFRRTLEEGTGWHVDVAEPGDRGAPTATVVLEVDSGLRRQCRGGVPGGYRLEVGDGQVRVSGDGPAGVFYGLQTLRQLLPDAMLRHASPVSSARPGRRAAAGPVALEPIVVEDHPRFSWRGAHLDVCRHFMPKSFLLKLVDLLAFHKCNVFHLHLTEDQGWRLPVDRYPRLVEVGAWRSQSPEGHARERRFDGVPHGGYYTKDDLRELVAFAAERHVTVVPEVDMPGHVVAALAAYPELGNGSTRRRLAVGTRWGVYSQVLNLEEPTLQFCADVIDELCELFPSPYVHVGGDECPTTEWSRSPKARALMATEGLTSVRQLQGWFTGKVAEQVSAHGRRVVGWDEVLEGGVPDDAVVMSWRGVKGGVDAALAGHDVVMAPEEWLYFDWAYSDDPAEPLAIRGATSVEKVYSFDPVPPAVPEDLRHHVLGAQCQLWTEYVPTSERAEYQERAGRGSTAPAGNIRAMAEGEPLDRQGRHIGKWRWPRWLPPPKVLLVVMIVAAFALLLYRIRGDLGTALHRVRAGGLVWLPAAFVAEGVSFFAYALVQRRLLEAGGAHMTRRTVATLTVAATGISNLVPGGTAPSSGWLVTQYRRYGVPLPLALWAVLAGGFTAGISVVFLCLVGAGIAGLLAPAPFAGLLVLVAACAVAGVGLAHRLSAVREWLEHRHRLPGLRLARRVVRHAGDVSHFRATVPGGLEVYALNVANWVLDVAVLATGFAVLDLAVPWKALLFAYAAAQIAGSLAPVPGGIGFVEGGMIGALTLAGIPSGNAVLATVVYRLVTTLGMAGIGSLALVFVHRRTPTPVPLTGIAATIARRAAGDEHGEDGVPTSPAP